MEAGGRRHNASGRMSSRSFGGLRHAETTRYLSIAGRPLDALIARPVHGRRNRERPEFVCWQGERVRF
jgi:hypothetical protein